MVWVWCQKVYEHTAICPSIKLKLTITSLFQVNMSAISRSKQYVVMCDAPLTGLYCCCVMDAWAHVLMENPVSSTRAEKDCKEPRTNDASEAQARWSPADFLFLRWIFLDGFVMFLCSYYILSCFSLAFPKILESDQPPSLPSFWCHEPTSKMTSAA